MSFIIVVEDNKFSQFKLVQKATVPGCSAQFVALLKTVLCHTYSPTIEMVYDKYLECCREVVMFTLSHKVDYRSQKNLNQMCLV